MMIVLEKTIANTVLPVMGGLNKVRKSKTPIYVGDIYLAIPKNFKKSAQLKLFNDAIDKLGDKEMTELSEKLLGKIFIRSGTED